MVDFLIVLVVLWLIGVAIIEYWFYSKQKRRYTVARFIIWLIIYVLFLGIFSFKFEYKDGKKINLKGWPISLSKRRLI